jgi:hypothetical protein
MEQNVGNKNNNNGKSSWWWLNQLQQHQEGHPQRNSVVVAYALSSAPYQSFSQLQGDPNACVVTWGGGEVGWVFKSNGIPSQTVSPTSDHAVQVFDGWKGKTQFITIVEIDGTSAAGGEKVIQSVPLHPTTAATGRKSPYFYWAFALVVVLVAFVLGYYYYSKKNNQSKEVKDATTTSSAGKNKPSSSSASASAHS